MICEQCGGSRVVSYPPPACGCPGCGAPVCCQTCCDARHDGYNREGNRSESPSSPTIPKMQAFAPMEEMARLRREHSAMEKARDQAVDIALKTQFALASANSARDVQTALLADASAQALALRTECDRQQEWVDAVMGQETAAITFINNAGPAVMFPSKHIKSEYVIMSKELIIRPRPLAKE